MKIVTLIENTCSVESAEKGIGVEHGLALYIDTGKHRILMDTGASGLLLKYAENCSVDLASVDTVFLSHGHSDHGGGLPDFLELNTSADVFVRNSAMAQCYSLKGSPHYIGLDPSIAFSAQIKWCSESFLKIDDELEIFSDIPEIYPAPSSNSNLMIKTDAGLVRDNFDHEQCLVVKKSGTACDVNNHVEPHILFSGCAHHGILNILYRYHQIYGGYPATVVTGFHLKKETEYSGEQIQEIKELARSLTLLPTRFFTCHCTGEKAYEIMKSVMKAQLEYIRCGDSVTI